LLLHVLMPHLASFDADRRNIVVVPGEKDRDTDSASLVQKIRFVRMLDTIVCSDPLV
jgi:hypothetical protein